tara:strand:- start:605 stop:1048 length:444 start_codon:yes stop_codon:yes gene_type:complete
MAHGDTLSPKQIHFAALVGSENKTQTDAYLASYNVKKMTRRMASTEASALMKIPKIKERVEKLRHDVSVSKHAIIAHDRDWIISQVTDIVGDEDARDADKLRALEILSKISGLYDDSKTQVVIEQRSSTELKAELKEKLSKYLGVAS